MKKINIAQIGYGYWGKRLYRYFKNDNKFFVKYVFAFNVKNNKEFITDINKIWQDKSIEAVVIASPINTHYFLTKKTLLSGKNVLCEKPLALKVKEVLELKKIAQKRDLLILTEFTYTFSVSLKKAEEIIKKGIIGKVESIELSLKYAGRFLEYNVYWLLGSHLLSILDIFVSLKSLKFKKIDFIKHNKRVETGMILFSGKNIKGKMTVSLNYPEKEMKAIIYGQKGTLIYSSMEKPSLRLICYKKREGILGDKLITKQKNYDIDEKNNLKFAVEYFYKMLKGKAESNINKAVQVTKILKKIND